MFRPHSSVKPEDSKILAVHIEDFSNAFALSNPDECGIGKVHRTVGVLPHQFAHSRNVHQRCCFLGDRVEIPDLWPEDGRLEESSIPNSLSSAVIVDLLVMDLKNFRDG